MAIDYNHPAANHHPTIAAAAASLRGMGFNRLPSGIWSTQTWPNTPELAIITATGIAARCMSYDVTVGSSESELIQHRAWARRLAASLRAKISEAA